MTSLVFPARTICYHPRAHNIFKNSQCITSLLRKISKDWYLGSFTEWLIEDGKALARENQCPDMWHMDSSQVSAVWEVMSMLKAYQHLIMLESKFTNCNGKAGHGRYSPDDTCPTREVTLIPFRTFGIEDISMLAVVADTSSESKLIVNPASVLR